MIAAGSGQPLAKARVSFSSDAGTAADPIFTDTNGAFAFPNLPAGHYTLSAEKSGYARARYGSKGPFDPPMEITVVGGAVVQGLDVALTKGAAIVGRIVDELGDPIVGGIVSLGAVQSFGSGLRLVGVARGTAETNDLGEYRIGDLLPGRYFVSVAGAGLGTMPSGMPREWERLKAWGRTFFPGSGGLANATPIVIGTGEERSGVDFVVVPSAQSTLFLNVSGGTTFDPRADAAAALADNVRQRAGPVTINFVPADATLGAAIDGNTQVAVGSGLGSYGMPMPGRVGPGNWIAVARQGSNGVVVPFTISQGDSDVLLTIALAPPSRVSGRVIFEGARPPASAIGVQVDVHGAGVDTTVPSRVLTRAAVTPKADGTFDIADLMGTIELQATTPPGWTLKALRYNGRDLLDDPLVLKSGEDVAGIQVVLSDQVATLSGTTADSSGQPVAGCPVAVFSAEGTARFSSRRMRLVRADQTGRFRVLDVPSGSYFAVAATDIDASVWLTPEFLDRLRPRATPLTLSDREQKTIALPCVSAQ